jgi:hypothetical protein
MKNKLKKLTSTLAIGMAFLLIACSAYSYYDEIIEIDFLSSHSSFENPDMEGLLADKQNKTKIFIQSSSPVISFSSSSCIEQFPLSSSLNLFPQGAISILRC